MPDRIATEVFYLPEIYTGRPGSQTIHAFNRSLEKAGFKPVQHQPSTRWTNVARHLDDRDMLRNFLQAGKKAYLVALMWPKAARLFPVGYFREIIPLCFDCWPADYDVWEALFRRHKVKTAFFTARQSGAYFQQKIPELSCHWLPEGCDPEEYPFASKLVERNIDVLELGRRYEVYHDKILEPLLSEQLNHLYARGGMRRLFSTRQELMQAWEQTRISVCFPKSITSFERSGGVETVTFRYFESMASRSLVVGHCPGELQDIFGYNPVIEVDMSDPAGQLLDILRNIEDYQELVEKNHRKMLKVGSWDARVQTMTGILESEGYSQG
jgi:hypothetical protein